MKQRDRRHPWRSRLESFEKEEMLGMVRETLYIEKQNYDQTYGWITDRKRHNKEGSKKKNRSFPGYEEDEGEEKERGR